MPLLLLLLLLLPTSPLSRLDAFTVDSSNFVRWPGYRVRAIVARGVEQASL